MHRVLIRILRLHRLKGSCSDVQRQFRGLNTALPQVVQHFLRKMQSRRRSSHRALNLTVYGLISCLVAFFCRTVQIGWNRQLSLCIQQLRKTHSRIFPTEPHLMRVTRRRKSFSMQNTITQHARLPLLQVANHALPRTTACRRKCQLIISWNKRLQAENLYPCAAIFMKNQARRYHASIIIHKERTCRDVIPNTIKHVLTHFAVTINQQLRVITLCQRILSYPLIRQRIIIFAY